jgi:rifampicin phosphotransferase
MGYDRNVAVADITGDSLSKSRWPVDNEPSSQFPIFTRANIGEVFPEVVKPFSWTLWGIPHSEPGWRQALVNLGAFDLEEFTPNRMEMLSVFGGYGYLNVSASRIFGTRAPGLSPEAIDASFFGEQPDVPPYVEEISHSSAKHEQQLSETISWVLSSPSMPELLETRGKLITLRNERPNLSQLSDRDLFQRCLDICEQHWEPLWIRHIMATYHSMIPSGVIAQVCDAVGASELCADILTVDGEVDSALPAKRLWELGRLVRASERLSRYLDDIQPATLEAIATDPNPDCQEFRFKFQAFIDEFGFRGPNEWEVASRCWELDPTAPLSALAIMAKGEEDVSPDARLASRRKHRETAIAEVQSRLKEDTELLGQFNAALAAARTFFAARERTRTNCAILTHEMRMPMWELGARYAADDVFSAPQDFSMLMVNEWTQLLDNSLNARELVSNRKKESERLASLDPPFIIDSIVPPLNKWREREATEHSSTQIITGQPGCAGTYIGRAKVISDPSNPGDLQPQDVLVARHTDPSWTPLFSAVSAVVVDVGATISHAVIVARELGVPCVTSATNATSLIPDGALIEVNGSTGTVTILE